MLWQIETSFACAGVITDDSGTIIETAPIYKWMLGKKIDDVLMWKRIIKVARCGSSKDVGVAQ